MHKICAFVTIIHPHVYVKFFVADGAESLKVPMHEWNGVDKSKRMVVIVQD